MSMATPAPISQAGIPETANEQFLWRRYPRRGGNGGNGGYANGGTSYGGSTNGGNANGGNGGRALSQDGMPETANEQFFWRHYPRRGGNGGNGGYANGGTSYGGSANGGNANGGNGGRALSQDEMPETSNERFFPLLYPRCGGNGGNGGNANGRNSSGGSANGGNGGSC